MNVVELSTRQSYVVSSIEFTYDELKRVYRKLKQYPKEVREQIVEEAVKLNGFNVFESIIEDEKEFAREQYRELQKGYMKLYSNS